MNKVPCYKCLVFIMCKQKIRNCRNSVITFAEKSDCPAAWEFVAGADQNDINNMREIFGLEPYI